MKSFPEGGVWQPAQVVSWKERAVEVEKSAISRQQSVMEQPPRGFDPLLGQAFQDAPAAMCLVSRDSNMYGRIVRANNAFTRLMRLADDPLWDTSLLAYISAEDGDRVAALLRAGLTGETHHVLDLQILTNANGEPHRFPGRLRIGFASTDPDIAIVDITDVTRDSMALQGLRTAALTDPLTQLPNRTLVLDRLQHALNSDRRLGQGVCVFFLDVDHFKGINDSYGHKCGDFALQTVANRISGALRGGDTVGRIGGDEFVIVAPSVTGESADALRHRIESVVANVVELPNGISISMSVSIGYVTSSAGDDAADLLEAADMHMYARKLRYRASLTS